MKATISDLTLARAILRDLSDRAGIPEWIGSRHLDADMIANDIAELIAEYRLALAGDPTEGT